MAPRHPPASTHPPACPPAPFAAPPPLQQGQQQQQEHRCHWRGGGGHTNSGYGGGGPQPSNQVPTPPWSGGFNPWTAVVHAYTMPMPCPLSPAYLVLGRRLIGLSSLCRSSLMRRPTAACRPTHPPSRRAGTLCSSPPSSKSLLRAHPLVACLVSWIPAPPLTWLLIWVTYPHYLPLPLILASSSATALVFLSLTLATLFSLHL
jgi:hypothetical protein